MRCPKCSKFMRRVNEGEMMDGWLCVCEWFIDFDYEENKEGRMGGVIIEEINKRMGSQNGGVK